MPDRPVPRLQAWQRRPAQARWELVEQPAQGDSGFAVAEYAKQQDAHTLTAVAQRHGLLTKQVLAKVTRLVQDVQRQSKALAATLAGFRVDPSAGASKVRVDSLRCCVCKL